MNLSLQYMTLWITVHEITVHELVICLRKLTSYSNLSSQVDIPVIFWLQYMNLSTWQDLSKKITGMSTWEDKFL